MLWRRSPVERCTQSRKPAQRIVGRWRRGATLVRLVIVSSVDSRRRMTHSALGRSDARCLGAGGSARAVRSARARVISFACDGLMWDMTAHACCATRIRRHAIAFARTHHKCTISFACAARVRRVVARSLRRHTISFPTKARPERLTGVAAPPLRRRRYNFLRRLTRLCEISLSRTRAQYLVP